MRLLERFQRRPRLPIAVCRTCEKRNAGDGAPAQPSVRKSITRFLNDVAKAHRPSVASSECLTHCPLSGVSVRVDHRPSDHVAGTLVIVDRAFSKSSQDALLAAVRALAERRAKDRDASLDADGTLPDDT